MSGPSHQSRFRNRSGVTSAPGNRPRSAAASYRVRQYAPFGREQPMALSVYAWETTGPVAELVEKMAGVLAVRSARAG